MHTTSLDSGYFEFALPPHEAGGPIDIEITTKKEKLTIRNVLFGDVWLLGGQSNMQLWMKRLNTRYPKAIGQANNSKIRFFQVPQYYNFSSTSNELKGGQWKQAVGSNVEVLSGIGYFFAEQRFQKNHVPVGLISTALGGERIKSYMSYATLKNLGELPVDFDRLKSKQYISIVQKEDDIYQRNYQINCDQSDQGLIHQWMKPNIDDHSWKKVYLNQAWPHRYCLSGVIYLRKKITIQDKLVGQQGILYLGTLIDADDVFLDGDKIGSTTYQYPPREYNLGPLKKTFELVIRLKIYHSPGGIRQNKPHFIVTKTGKINLDTLGPWAIKRANWLPTKKEQVFFQYQPVGLFNGMIYPLRYISFAGILWYQGESDTGHPEDYGLLFTHLIQEWRQLFNCPSLPFLFVQLPNCGIEPQHSWARLREQQRQGLLLNNTAMVISLGLGDDNDLHPTRKKEIAIQLSTALDLLPTYPNGYCTGPLALNAMQDNKRIIVNFQTFGQLLCVSSKGYFELIDRYYSLLLKSYRTIDNEIIIDLPFQTLVSEDARIRYNYSNVPRAFVRNDLGRPAAPFELSVHSISVMPVYQ